MSLLQSTASPDVAAILNKAASKALNGGTAGASAAAVQVVTLMWLRTALNYQYRYGTSTREALSTLYAEGGVARLYQGLPFALVQGPLSRFGDTAANALLASLFDSLDPASAVYPLPLRTAAGSLAAGLWRVLLSPVDTAKTVMQVDGGKALPLLWERVQTQGPGVLFSGALASSAATFVGHFPWFLTYNYLSVQLPPVQQFVAENAPLLHGMGVGGEEAQAAQLLLVLDLLRSACIGLCASSLSDVCSNSLRVLKTSRQAAVSVGEGGGGGKDGEGSSGGNSYVELARGIIAQDGWAGLLGRGLQTRLLSNALQGMLFSVLLKLFQQQSGPGGPGETGGSGGRRG
ncbi:mitochondrial carrier domain-containing protein [Ochromonadaceae sp. CCMP2298]|nr:mitochondrial carrier domain-containing protein [Ochromonadaceae sp. CCMP2298]